MTDSSFRDLHWLLDIIQSTDIGIIVVDRQFQIEIYNRFMQVHGKCNAEDVIGTSIFEVFPYLDDDWFRRRVGSVFELGIPVHTTWEQRPSVFQFRLELPVHYEMSVMYQNTTFVPLRSSHNEVEKVGIIVYDVTETALNSLQLQQAKKQLLELSRTDRLTGLWNRGYWEERLNEEFKRKSRSDQAISLVMFDIDHFKKINDGYGHHVGDEAIRSVSRLLLENSRDIDLCGRYGGEEFAVILPNTDRAGAHHYCERLRDKIAEQRLRINGVTIQFSISLGIAVLDRTMKNAADWIVAADSALYQSKEGGRNRTTVYNAAG